MIDVSHKELTKSNGIFAEFKTESEKQFADLKNEKFELKDEFEESKKILNKVKEELSQKIIVMHKYFFIKIRCRIFN